MNDVWQFPIHKEYMYLYGIGQTQRLNIFSSCIVMWDIEPEIESLKSQSFEDHPTV